MQKWEYCNVHWVYHGSLSEEIEGTVTVTYCRPAGSEVKSEKFKVRAVPKPKRLKPDTQDIWDAESELQKTVSERGRQIVAQLGLEGWELVSNGTVVTEFWLKRPME